MAEWLFTNKGKSYLEEHYVQAGESTHIIANALSTYPNMVVRALKHHHIILRTKSEAQKLAMATGRQKHPTQGKKMSKEVKDKIGESVSSSWKVCSLKERRERSKIAQEQWEKYTQEERSEIRKLAMEGLRKASIQGSKTEIYLAENLEKLGWKVETKALLYRIHIDLLLKQKRLAIFVDGPSHYSPIWGVKRLNKRKQADVEENERLIQSGYSVIRIMNTIRNISEISLKNLLKNLVFVIESSKLDEKTVQIIGAV